MSNTAVYIIVALIVGVLISFQPPINASMARILESPLLAATVSLFISCILMFMLWLLNDSGKDLGQFGVLPWWIIVGGVAGAIFVTSSIIIAPVLGMAAFIVCIIAGQLIGSIFIDQFGLFGMEIKEINMQKTLGLILIFLGVILVRSD
ncbi:DMT family transporter [Nitrosomonas sp.]|uniref:DMT family transporter n=1 Tax=Nitrosomonas sp. TaxID=42353 RepID=UPI001D9FEDBD|nr:DMT family transporter [Nitrosomonas sp.]MCB1948844.1 DMT family transporter [Nitrosomonas sp.]MCP5241842.1 DMT family transporter [Burkholderiales bacterium]MDR4513173.1 DMT family transporter [Nitrosomonas sp.]